MVFPDIFQKRTRNLAFDTALALRRCFVALEMESVGGIELQE